MSFQSQVLSYLLNKYPELAGKDLTLYVSAAVAWVEGQCGRRFDRGTYTEELRVSNSKVFVHNIPLLSVQSVEFLWEDGTTSPLPVAFFVVNGTIWLKGNIRFGIVRVTYEGGYDVVPQDLVMLAGEIAHFLATTDLSVEELRSGDFTLNLNRDMLAQWQRMVLDRHSLGW